jgi:hypothetical protein
VRVHASRRTELHRDNRVARGAALLKHLRRKGYEVTVCHEHGDLAITPPVAIQELLNSIFCNSDVVLAALAAFPGERLDWENADPGDDDLPYPYGAQDNGAMPPFLTPEEYRRLIDLKQRRLTRPIDEQPEGVAR